MQVFKALDADHDQEVARPRSRSFHRQVAISTGPFAAETVFNPGLLDSAVKMDASKVKK